LIEVLDADGPEPDDRPEPKTNLHTDSGWTVRIRDGLPTFIPPRWIDPEQAPRRKPIPHHVR
jgi:hypothetical protein